MVYHRSCDSPSCVGHVAYLSLHPHAKASLGAGNFSAHTGESSKILASPSSCLFTYILAFIFALLSAATSMVTSGSYCPELPPTLKSCICALTTTSHQLSSLSCHFFFSSKRIWFFPSLFEHPLISVTSLSSFPFPSTLNSVVHHLATVFGFSRETEPIEDCIYTSIYLCKRQSIFIRHWLM